MKINYSREDKKALCKKYNDNNKVGKNEFEGFTLRDKIALAEFQVEILNENLKTFKKWLIVLIELRKELLIKESNKVLTKEGIKVDAVKTEKGFITWCKCGGSGKSPYGNICTHCYGKGYKFKNLKEVSESEYLEILKKKYYKKCKDKKEFPHPNADKKDIKFFEDYLK